MRIGLAEIVYIIIGIALVTTTFWISRKIRGSFSKKPPSKKPKEQKKEKQESRRNYTGIIGLALILISIILLWSGMRLLKWAFLSYSWFLLLAVIGILLLVLSRRRK